MTDTFIISGGNIQKDFALYFLNREISETGREDLFLVAVDRGLEFFMDTPLVPDAVVGDFDSLSPEGKQYLDSLRKTWIVPLNPVKDVSDTQAALDFCLERGSKRITLLGGIGTRMDHVLANLELLLRARIKGAEMMLQDWHNLIMLAINGMTLTENPRGKMYVSFFPLGGEVEGLTLEGFAYPLHNHTLRATDCSLTVSNRIQEKEARVTFKRGNLLMMLTWD